MNRRNRRPYRSPFGDPTAQVGSGLSYVGDGNFSSGEYGADPPRDFGYDYAGYKGDAGSEEEYGGGQYGNGRYGDGPYEQSQQYGGSAPDIADPRGFSIKHLRPIARHPRGPKGYRRSDERILEDVYLHLLRASHVDTSDVLVEVQSGVAMLTGSVPERRMKHAIEDIVSGVHDVTDVENRLRVQREPVSPRRDRDE